MRSHSIGKVFDALRQHLRAHVDRLECFGRYQFQAEGWLKAEWMSVLDQLKDSGQVQRLDREVSVKGQKKIDLALDLDDGRHWIELKHWFMGEQKGQRWGPRDYISELENECAKFATARAGERAWVLALCTRNPGSAAWLSAIREFNRDYSPWHLRSLDDPKRYPGNYFLGVLHVRGLDA